MNCAWTTWKQVDEHTFQQFIGVQPDPITLTFEHGEYLSVCRFSVEDIQIGTQIIFPGGNPRYYIPSAARKEDTMDSNTDRIDHFCAGLAAYVAHKHETGMQSAQCELIDFLTDCMHWCESTGVDMAYCLLGAEQQYETEKESTL